MDREKVINKLQAWIDDPYARDTAIDPTFVHDALALLKEQEPVQVVWKFAFPHCPECGQMLPEGDAVNYCLHCGRPVIW